MASVLLSFSGFLNIEKNYSDSVVLVLQYRITFACIMTFVLISGTYTVSMHLIYIIFKSLFFKTNF